MRKELNDLLYIFFNSDKYIGHLNERINILDKQIKSKEMKKACDSCTPEIIRILNKTIKERLSEKDKTLNEISNILNHKNTIDFKLKMLTERQRNILEYKYKKQYTDEEIGKKINLSQSQVNRIRNKALQKITES